jgi:sec-independent protein translocase protein TatA
LRQLTDFNLTLPDKQTGMNVSPILLGVLGTQEIIIIAIIILLLFGGRKIPELMRGLGKGIREFNDAKNTVRKEIEESSTETAGEAKK